MDLWGFRNVKVSDAHLIIRGEFMMPRNTLQIFYEDEEVYEPVGRYLISVYKLRLTNNYDYLLF
jgi:hypothetical protein